MRAISIRPAWLRRNSTSLTVMSNFADGSYVGPSLGEGGLKPATPTAVRALRKSRRSGRNAAMLTSGTETLFRLQQLANPAQRGHRARRLERQEHNLLRARRNNVERLE